MLPTFPAELQQSKTGPLPPIVEVVEPQERIRPDEAMVVLLHQIFALLKSLQTRIGAEPFELLVVVPNVGTGQRQSGTDASGVVLGVHNPTAAPIVLTLTDGMSNPKPIFNASLIAGESRGVYLPFTKELVAFSGTNCQVTGTYRP